MKFLPISLPALSRPATPVLPVTISPETGSLAPLSLAMVSLMIVALTGTPATAQVARPDLRGASEDPPVAAYIDARTCEAQLSGLVDRTPIIFEPGRANLEPSGRDVLDRVATVMEQCPASLVSIAGHTDSDGTDESNYRLSLARAQTVVDMLVAAGIEQSRFTATGYGESRPLASNASETGKLLNRRIEFVLRE